MKTLRREGGKEEIKRVSQIIRRRKKRKRRRRIASAVFLSTIVGMEEREI